MAHMKWKIVEWSQTKEPETIKFFNSIVVAKIYKFFEYDIFFTVNSQYVHWSIEKNV